MRTIRTPEKKRIVLDAISHGLTVAEAARAAGISRRAVFDWKASDPLFARDYEAAYEAGTDVFEAEARRRAFTESDTLLIFLLKSRDPRRFNRRMLAIGGDLDNPLSVTHTQHDSDEVVHFYMPSNRRDQPEQDEAPDEQQPAGSVTIEGTISDDGKAEDEAA